jgi:hypothetical protein
MRPATPTAGHSAAPPVHALGGAMRGRARAGHFIKATHRRGWDITVRLGRALWQGPASCAGRTARCRLRPPGPRPDDRHPRPVCRPRDPASPRAGRRGAQILRLLGQGTLIADPCARTATWASDPEIGIGTLSGTTCGSPAPSKGSAWVQSALPEAQAGESAATGGCPDSLAKSQARSVAVLTGRGLGRGGEEGGDLRSGREVQLGQDVFDVGVDGALGDDEF